MADIICISTAIFMAETIEKMSAVKTADGVYDRSATVMADNCTCRVGLMYGRL